MATARARGKGYEIRVFCGLDGKGQRIDKGKMWYPEASMSPLQIRKELERQKTLFEELVRHGKVYDSNMNFRQLTDIWFQDYAKKQLAPKTYARYLSLSDRIYKAIGHMKLKDLKPMHLNRFYDDLSQAPNKKTGKHLAPKTILAYHRLVSKILSTAVKWDIIDKNVATRATPPKVPHKEIAYLNEEEAKQMIALLKNENVQYRTMILLLLHSGMRRGEMLGLEWKDLDWNNQTLRIVRSSQYIGYFITNPISTMDTGMVDQLALYKIKYDVSILVNNNKLKYRINLGIITIKLCNNITIHYLHH